MTIGGASVCTLANIGIAAADLLSSQFHNCLLRFSKMIKPLVLFVPLLAIMFAQGPHPIPGGYDLPNGWRITPVGKAIHTEDLILNLVASKDERIVVALH